MSVAYRRGLRSSPNVALRSISTAIPGGSIAALVGPNGAGKSTLLRTWVGYERPSSGTASVHGTNPVQHHGARLIGYVPQRPYLHPQLSAAEYFTVARQWRPGFDGALAARSLELAGIDLRRPVGRLSGGQQAQVALSLAFGTRAPVLLLDEPLAHLDPLSRRDFLELVGSHAREHGTTVLLSSHILSDISLICDRLVLLHEGGILVDAAMSEALSAHSVVRLEDEGATPGERIGVCDSMGAEVLIRHAGIARSTGRAPSLDELVLAHLDGARSPLAGTSR